MSKRVIHLKFDTGTVKSLWRGAVWICLLKVKKFQLFLSIGYISKSTNNQSNAIGFNRLTMRRSILSITILVIVLQTSASEGQDIWKRHITSNLEENQTAPNVGPALRPYSVEPISHKLRA